MQNIFITLLIINIVINILLLFAYIRLKSFIKSFDLERYKNCIMEMMRIKTKFDEVSEKRVRELQNKIEELEELTEVVDEKLIMIQEIDNDNIEY